MCLENYFLLEYLLVSTLILFLGILFISWSITNIQLLCGNNFLLESLIILILISLHVTLFNLHITPHSLFLFACHVFWSYIRPYFLLCALSSTLFYTSTSPICVVSSLEYFINDSQGSLFLLFSSMCTALIYPYFYTHPCIACLFTRLQTHFRYCAWCSCIKIPLQVKYFIFLCNSCALCLINLHVPLTKCMILILKNPCTLLYNSSSHFAKYFWYVFFFSIWLHRFTLTSSLVSSSSFVSSYAYKFDTWILMICRVFLETRPNMHYFKTSSIKILHIHLTICTLRVVPFPLMDHNFLSNLKRFKSFVYIYVLLILFTFNIQTILYLCIHFIFLWIL